MRSLPAAVVPHRARNAATCARSSTALLASAVLPRCRGGAPSTACGRSPTLIARGCPALPRPRPVRRLLRASPSGAVDREAALASRPRRARSRRTRSTTLPVTPSTRTTPTRWPSNTRPTASSRRTPVRPCTVACREVADDARRTFAGFGDAKAAPLRGWVKDHVVVSEVAWTGTQSGEYLGIESGAKPVGLVALRVLHLTDDGHVAEAHEYADAAGLVAQMAGKKWGRRRLPSLPRQRELGMHVAKDSPDEEKLAAPGPRASTRPSRATTPRPWPRPCPKAPTTGRTSAAPPSKGKRAIEKSLTAWFKAFPDQKWGVEGGLGSRRFAWSSSSTR